MTNFTSGATPGFQPTVESEETQVTWSGRGGQTQIATRPAMVAAANIDTGNNPATTLRGGHVLAIDDATGEAHLYDPDANDGTQIAVGVLEQALDMLQAGVATPRFVQMLVRGLLKEAELRGLDPRAKQQLASRFLFDRDLKAGAGELMHPRGVYRKSENTTLTAADNGLLFIATDTVTFTLPSKQNGLAFRFLQIADANMVILGASDLVVLNNAAATSVTYGATNAKIGSHALVECMYTAEDTLRWVVTNLGGTTMSIA